jgi:hypothetical protein
MDPMTLMAISGGVGTLGSLGTATGLFQSPQERAAAAQAESQKSLMDYQSRRNPFIRQYLEKNLGDFKHNYKGFDQNKYSDILNPITDRFNRDDQALRNNQALSGGLGGGVSLEQQARNDRGQNRDFSNTVSSLRREDENQDWQRAMQKYLTKRDNTLSVAPYV